MSKGLILEINEDYAIVLTPDGQFKNVQKPRNAVLAVGQELEIPRIEVDHTAVLNSVQTKTSVTAPVRKRSSIYLKPIALAASFLLILAAAFSFLPFGFDDHAIAFIHVDINPSIEIRVNAALQVISVVGLNEDGENMLRAYAWKGKALEDVTTDIVHLAEKNGYLSTNRDILVVTSFLDEETEEKYATPLAMSLQRASDQLYAEEASHLAAASDTVETDIGSMGIMDDSSVGQSETGDYEAAVHVEDNQQLVIHQTTVKASAIKEAQEQGVSLGRYQIYVKSQEMGIELNLDDIKRNSMTQLLLLLAQADELFNPVHTTHPGKGQGDDFVPPGQQKKAQEQDNQNHHVQEPQEDQSISAGQRNGDRQSTTDQGDNDDNSQKPISTQPSNGSRVPNMSTSDQEGRSEQSVEIDLPLPAPALQRAPANVIERIFSKDKEDEKKNDAPSGKGQQFTPPGQQIVPPGLQKKGETEHPSQKGKNN